MILSILISAVVFGCAAFLGMQLSEWLGSTSSHKRLDADPRSVQGLTIILTVCTALIGGVLASRAVPIVSFVTLGIVCVSLCAAWYSDSSFGYIPDYFTLLPLGLLLAVALFERNFSYTFNLIWASLIPFLPFGIAAALSKGRGMGWSDSKLAALGGAVLGILPALLTFAAACLALVAVGWIRGRRNQPLAFAPYLAVAIVLGVLARVIISTT